MALYNEIIKEQDIRDNRRNFIQTSMKYIEKSIPLDLLFRDEVVFIHETLMKGDYYQTVN